MMNDIPLVGSLATGFGNSAISTPNVKTPDLKQASQDFVAMLYSYMFTQMRESGSDEENGLFSGDHANMMMGFLDQEIGKKMAGSEGQNGLSGALMKQLQQQQGSSDSEKEASLSGADAPLGAALANSVRDFGEDSMKNQPLTMDDSEDNSSQQMLDELYKLNQR